MKYCLFEEEKKLLYLLEAVITAKVTFSGTCPISQLPLNYSKKTKTAIFKER